MNCSIFLNWASICFCYSLYQCFLLCFFYCAPFFPVRKKTKQNKWQNKTTAQLSKQACAYLGAFRLKLTDRIFHLFTKVSLQPFFIIAAAF